MVAKTLMIAGAALVAAFAASPAAAQQSSPPPASGPGETDANALFDANRDGFVERGEWDTRMAAIFAANDRNADGKLSTQEAIGALRALAARLNAVRGGGGGPPNAGDDRRGDDNNRAPGPRRFQQPFGPYGPHYGQPFGPRFQPYWPQFRQFFGPRFPQPFQRRDNRDDDRRDPDRGSQQGTAPNAPATPPAAQGGAAPQAPGPGAAPQGGAPRPGVSPNFAALDRNGDGVITPDEFAAAGGR
jgi:hypothetical protein